MPDEISVIKPASYAFSAKLHWSLFLWRKAITDRGHNFVFVHIDTHT